MMDYGSRSRLSTLFSPLRYLDHHNVHAQSYTWKRLGRPLDMSKTLEANQIADEKQHFIDLGLDPDDHIITLHLYFKDDLTEA